MTVPAYVPDNGGGKANLYRKQTTMGGDALEDELALDVTEYENARREELKRLRE